MTKPEEKPKKTRQELLRSAMNTLWLALLIDIFPVIYIVEYRKFGYIYSGKPAIIKTTGIDALVIMYGTLAVAITASLYAAYNFALCINKIRKSDCAAYATVSGKPLTNKIFTGLDDASPLSVATLITSMTILVLIINELGGFIILGFPILIIEFAVIYIIVQHITRIHSCK